MLEEVKLELEVDEKEELEKAYIEIMKELKDFPSYSDLIVRGISKAKIRTKFGGISNLKNEIWEKYQSEIHEIVTTINSAFAKEKSASNLIGKSKRYVITTAVASAPVHQGFISALETYAELNDAKIVIMPCEAVSNSFENHSAVFDKTFNDPSYFFVDSDIQLCNNLSLCSIQVSANQVKPITGLARIGKRSGSYVFASPKQFLEYYPNGNKRGSNYAIMTPGSCTKASYFTETFVSKRLSYIAENDHTLGAIIVEICDDNHHFHFRQIQADDEGSFVDLGKKYEADGSVSSMEAIVVLGDIHGVSVETKAVEKFAQDLAAKDVKVSSVFVHDLFDGKSINHHEKTIGARAKNYQTDNYSLLEELNETANVLMNIYEMFEPENVFVVKSNHDEFLDRYLKEGRYISDPANYHISLKLALDMFEGRDPLQQGLLKYSGPAIHGDTAEAEKFTVFLSRESSCKIAGVELAAHGDMGMNGAKPSMNGMEMIYGKCVIGHNHAASIQRGVFRVGTMSKLDMNYNTGPSSWTHTNALVYANGQVQLLNYMNGEYFI